MIFVYDFDGTLTPHSLPQYEILKNCGYGYTEKLLKRVEEEMEKNSISLYESYYKCYISILNENGISISTSNICLGADRTELNAGVEEYFKSFQSSKTGVKHYIVTAGLKEYVDRTIIRKYVDATYGVTLKEEGDTVRVDFLLTDVEKVSIIKEIQKNNNGTNDIVYFGDGLTDNFAFQYVHSIGGKNILVANNKFTDTSMDTYRKINKDGIIDKYFEADFSAEISDFIKKQIELI